MNLFHYVIMTEKNPTFSNLEPIFHPLSFQMHSVITKMKKKKKVQNQVFSIKTPNQVYKRNLQA